MYCLLSSQQVCILAPLERARHGVGILIWGKRENNTEAKQKNEQNTWKEFFNKEIWKTKHIEKTVWYVCSQVMQLRIKHRFQKKKKNIDFSYQIDCCCSVTKSCPTLCDPMNCSIPGFPVLHCLLELAQSHVHWVSDQPSNQWVSHPTISSSVVPFLSSIFPSMRFSSNELALHIRWPKYWSFSFSNSPSNEYSVLIFFRIDWFVCSTEL